MFSNNPDHQFDEEFYFVSEPDRFFSFQLIQTPSLSISMIEIELQSGKEDPNSTQVTIKEVASMNEAIAFIVELVHQKTIQGYSLLDPSERSQYKELTRKKKNTAEQPLEISFTSSEEAKPVCDVAIKSPSSQSEYLLVADDVSRSEDKTVSDDYELIEENKDDHLEPENDPIEGCASNSSEPLVAKTFKIADLQQKDIELAINKAAEYELKYQLTSDSIQVVGKQSSLFEFLNWLYDHLNVTSNAQKQTICTKKMDISTFHRVNKEDILKKAEELNIECDFRYYMMLITGPSQSIDEFKNYLYKVEKSTKKALYPKYWDLEDTNMYSEFEVAPDSEEFKEVAPLMTDSVPRAEITKLIRIQNNYLMTLYITNINMRQEVNKEKNNRKLLFHGTKQVDPSVIYKSFDTGFDIAYAKEGGMFGKGLYFALNAAYSNAFAFPVNIKEAKYQLILADVFVGKSHNCFDSSNSIKPPEGYDSVHSRKDFYIIYNNFHSYPLYLMEYTLKKKPIPPPRPTQVHKVNFTQDNNTSTNTNMNYLTVPTLQMQPQTDLTSTNERQERLQTLKLRRREREQRAEKLMRLLSGKNKYIYNNRLSATALSRIHKDVLEIQADASLDFLFVEEPDEKNPSKYTLCLIGPSYSPYEGGLFKIQVTFPDDYPLNPPLVNFQTKIYHPCIDNEGKICLGLLDQWRPTGSLKQIALLLSALLYDPSLEEHIMPDISAQYQTHRQSFVSQAHSWTQKYSE